MLKLILEFYLTIAIPLIYLLGLIIISSSLLTTDCSLLTILSLTVTILSLLLWVGSYLTLRSSLTVMPKAEKLITSGPYHYFAHPIYIAITLVFLGLSLVTNSIPGLLYTILVIIPLNIIRAKNEEKTLRKKFDQKYKEYKKKVLF